MTSHDDAKRRALIEDAKDHGFVVEPIIGGQRFDLEAFHRASQRAGATAKHGGTVEEADGLALELSALLNAYNVALSAGYGLAIASEMRKQTTEELSQLRSDLEGLRLELEAAKHAASIARSERIFFGALVAVLLMCTVW